MAVTWKITNCEYTNDSDKGVVHAAWQASDSEVVGSGDDAVAMLLKRIQAQYQGWNRLHLTHQILTILLTQA